MANVMIQICRLHRHKGIRPTAFGRAIGVNLLVMFLCAIPALFFALFWALSSYLIYVPVSPEGGSPLVASGYVLCMLLMSTCNILQPFSGAALDESPMKPGVVG